jgi:hypothetical protein
MWRHGRRGPSAKELVIHELEALGHKVTIEPNAA